MDSINFEGALERIKANAKDAATRQLGEAGYVQLETVKTTKVEWLLEPIIPMGSLTILEGDPSVGKSWIGLSLAASLSQGRALPDGGIRPPSKVILLLAEDGLAETVKPRLEVMGANGENIVAQASAITLTGKELENFETVIDLTRPVMILIDPLFSYVGGGTDIYRSNQVRPFLHRLTALAQKYHFALVAVRHLTKGARDRGIYRGSGAIDILAVARSVLLAGVDPHDRTRRGLAHSKTNLGPFGKTLGYQITQGGLTWLGPIELTAAEMLAPDPVVRIEALDEAKDFLSEQLSGGKKRSSDIFEVGKAKSFSERTLRRARSSMPIHAFQEGREWFWSLSGASGCHDVELAVRTPEPPKPLDLKGKDSEDSDCQASSGSLNDWQSFLEGTP